MMFDPFLVGNADACIYYMEVIYCKLVAISNMPTGYWVHVE